MQASHGVRIDQNALAQREGAMGAFNRKTVLLIKMNCRFVIHKHHQFQSRQIPPIIR